MSLFYIIIGILVLTLMWSIPSVVIAFTIKHILKRKLSKGWCFLVAAITFLICLVIETTLIGIHKPGTLDLIIRFACVSIIFIVLYDKNLPSIFDTEKEILRKRKLNDNQDANA